MVTLRSAWEVLTKTQSSITCIRMLADCDEHYHKLVDNVYWNQYVSTRIIKIPDSGSTIAIVQ